MKVQPYQILSFKSDGKHIMSQAIFLSLVAGKEPI